MTLKKPRRRVRPHARPKPPESRPLPRRADTEVLKVFGDAIGCLDRAQRASQGLSVPPYTRGVADALGWVLGEYDLPPRSE
jgi:hypothetical protein